MNPFPNSLSWINCKILDNTYIKGTFINDVVHVRAQGLIHHKHSVSVIIHTKLL